MSNRASGVLLVAKPAGVTSHDVVARIRRGDLARRAKVGHTGTLDPFATGLLLVLVGPATRFQRFFLRLSKTYRTRARFGARSDSGDPTGSIEPTGESADEDAIEAALPSLVGAIEQRVPLTSAVKVGGERLYRKARRGESFVPPLRTVKVKRFDLVAFDPALQEADLEIECSSGTYVRSLVRDLGDLCGAGAYCLTLERTSIGPFELDAADETRLVPLMEALAFLPERVLTPPEERLVRTGRPVASAPADPAEGPVRLTIDGELVAVAERHDGSLRPVTVIPE
jgi:tRNA pseudouridine55 synthase